MTNSRDNRMPTASELRIYDGFVGRVRRAKSVPEVGAIVDEFLARSDAHSILRSRLDQVATERINSINPIK